MSFLAKTLSILKSERGKVFIFELFAYAKDTILKIVEISWHCG